MADNFIITIARGYGSGGRTIGLKLSERLGAEFYDKDLIRLASDESGINEALFGQSDEKTKSSVFGKTGVYKGGVISPDKKAFTSEENLFNYQAMVIKKLAESGKPCIIVGRCADFVLGCRENVARVFVYADEENCVKNVADVKGITDRKEALKKIAAIDKERAAYYKAHTGREWIDARNYDLSLNSGVLGFDKCVDIIIDYINSRKN
ncbi:MAG: cytidylate kinase-like family protein [Oscillospiraceae bacterium]|nr:cytidylate kinase-like family protein [Oscillospiraceae bacterium]